MHSTLILGSGKDAQQMAAALSEDGTGVLWGVPDDGTDKRPNGRFHADAGEKVETIVLSGPVSCRSAEGGFAVMLTGRHETLIRSVSSIVLADDVERVPNFSLYGLEASSGVVSLSQLQASLESDDAAIPGVPPGGHIAFVTGLASESHPVTAGAVMRCALRLQQEFNLQTYIFTGNLKVAGSGLEALYRRTKAAGSLYVKFTASLPDIRPAANGRVTITYTDEIMRETFRLNPEVTVVDERLAPSALSRRLSEQLGLETGPDGFAQSDNVHRIPVLTNRKGIFVAGFSGGIQTDRARRANIESVVLCVRKHNLESAANPPEGKAAIDNGQCIRCLTCLRMCPYGAISLQERVAVDPFACEGCGICAAECPRYAIKMNIPAGKGIADRIPESAATDAGAAFLPSITAFCCSRSAEAAKDLAACMGHRLPEGLQVVSVPCAGGVSRDHIAAALRRGADGVMVMTCHPGNCHSEHGDRCARQRAGRIADLMPQIGLAPGRLAYGTIAANSGTEFAETLAAFARRVLDLGPSPLRATRA